MQWRLVYSATSSVSHPLCMTDFISLPCVYRLDQCNIMKVVVHIQSKNTFIELVSERPKKMLERSSGRMCTMRVKNRCGERDCVYACVRALKKNSNRVKRDFFTSRSGTMREWARVLPGKTYTEVKTQKCFDDTFFRAADRIMRQWSGWGGRRMRLWLGRGLSWRPKKKGKI